MDTKEITLSVVNIHKSYGKKQVLKNLKFEAYRNEIIGIIGENGAGKSTLLKILAGFINPNAGSVEIHGKLGYCPQIPRVYDRLTIQENIEIFGAAYDVSSKELQNHSDYLLERLNATKYKDTVVRNLSGGTLQKLNLIISLLHKPAILLLDEPYQGFDYESYKAFWELIREYQETYGTTIIIVSHLLHEQEKFNRIFELKGGQINEKH